MNDSPPTPISLVTDQPRLDRRNLVTDQPQALPACEGGCVTTHLSTRLVWHDRGWDGRICDNPRGNSSCISESVSSRSTARRDDSEEANAGQWLGKLEGRLPPAARDPNVFSDQPFTITHFDPIDGRNLAPVTEEAHPFVFPISIPMDARRELSPNHRRREFGNCRSIRSRENNWLDLRSQSPDQITRCLLAKTTANIIARLLLCQPWQSCRPGSNTSPGWRYGQHAHIHDQVFFRHVEGIRGRTTRVDSLCHVHDFPKQGFRLPYQEYLRKGHSLDRIKCPVPDGAMGSFSFVSDHVTDDIAVGVLEQLLQSVQAVHEENLVPGDWENQIAWLNDVLAEVWTSRGPFPGAGSVLEYLGNRLGTSFQRQVLSPRFAKGDNAWEYVESILEGRTPCEEPRYAQGMKTAASRWTSYTQSRRDLLKRLLRFELTPEQVARIANPNQRAPRLASPPQTKSFIANPYLIYESDQGGEGSPPVALEAIDRGMRPEGAAAHFQTNIEDCPA